MINMTIPNIGDASSPEVKVLELQYKFVESLPGFSDVLVDTILEINPSFNASMMAELGAINVNASSISTGMMEKDDIIDPQPISYIDDNNEDPMPAIYGFCGFLAFTVIIFAFVRHKYPNLWNKYSCILKINEKKQDNTANTTTTTAKSNNPNTYPSLDALYSHKGDESFDIENSYWSEKNTNRSKGPSNHSLNLSFEGNAKKKPSSNSSHGIPSRFAGTATASDQYAVTD
jgi:hypothetical protein